MSPYPNLQRMPGSRLEWQATARSVAGLLMIAGARDDGYVKGGPEIDRERCEEILALAQLEDVVVNVDQALQAGADILRGFNDVDGEDPDA